jgi:hypothetical protein
MAEEPPPKAEPAHPVAFAGQKGPVLGIGKKNAASILSTGAPEVPPAPKTKPGEAKNIQPPVLVIKSMNPGTLSHSAGKVELPSKDPSGIFAAFAKIRTAQTAIAPQAPVFPAARTPQPPLSPPSGAALQPPTIGSPFTEVAEKPSYKSIESVPASAPAPPTPPRASSFWPAKSSGSLAGKDTKTLVVPVGRMTRDTARIKLPESDQPATSSGPAASVSSPPQIGMKPPSSATAPAASATQPLAWGLKPATMSARQMEQTVVMPRIVHAPSNVTPPTVTPGPAISAPPPRPAPSAFVAPPEPSVPDETYISTEQTKNVIQVKSSGKSPPPPLTPMPAPAAKAPQPPPPVAAARPLTMSLAMKAAAPPPPPPLTMTMAPPMKTAAPPPPPLSMAPTIKAAAPPPLTMTMAPAIKAAAPPPLTMTMAPAMKTAAPPPPPPSVPAFAAKVPPPPASSCRCASCHCSTRSATDSNCTSACTTSGRSDSASTSACGKNASASCCETCRCQGWACSGCILRRFSPARRAGQAYASARDGKTGRACGNYGGRGTVNRTRDDSSHLKLVDGGIFDA